MAAKRGFHAHVPLLVVMLSCVILVGAQPSPVAPSGPGLRPIVLQPVRHDVSPALRHLPPIEPKAPPVFREIPRQPLPRRGPPGPGLPDPVIQGSPGPGAMPAPKQGFEGVGNVNNVLPPDTNGDVGPNHYVQWVNLSFAIFNKNGERIYGPAAGNTLWQGAGPPCENRNDGDPIVLYDHLADRWLFSQFALPNGLAGPFYQCIAVSQTPDPTGAYYRYAFKISDTKLNDYPKFGVWPDGYYMAINQFTCFIFCFWAGQGAVVFDRAAMVAGAATASGVYFDLFLRDPNLGGMLPSDLDGPPPPLGTPNYFVQFDDDAWGYSPDQLQVWAFSVNWAAPLTSTFTMLAAHPTAAFDSNMCGGSRNCIPQKGTTRKVDAIADRLMYRLQYRDFGAYGAMVVNHTVDVNGNDHAGIRWYELRNAGAGWFIYQQGTYAPDANHRWMGSMAMDGAGNVALGFSVSEKNLYPSIRYTGRLFGDPLGTMTQAEASIQEGGGSQTHSSGRWGDYSMMAVDPVDDCTFWYTQQYYATTSSAGWKTRIGAFKFASCGPAPSGADLSIAKADSPDPVTVGTDLTYTLTVTNHGPETATGVTATDTLPVGVTLKSATPSQGTCNTASNPITCSLGSLNNTATATVSIVVTPTAAGPLSNSAAVSGNEADPDTSNNNATAETTVTEPAPPPPSDPVVNACNPSNGNRNEQLLVQVTGSNFQAGAAASFGDRVMVQSVTFVNAGRLDVLIKVHPRAASGPRDVTVTNPGGKAGTKAGCFNVN